MAGVAREDVIGGIALDAEASHVGLMDSGVLLVVGDGFFISVEGPLQLRLDLRAELEEGLLRGFALGGGWVGQGLDQGRLRGEWVW